MEKTILVVDDHQDIVETVETLLQTQGYAVLTAGNGEELFASVKEQIPKLIILDIMMPGLMTKDILKRLDETPGMQEIPVILLSAVQLSDEEKMLLMQNHHVVDFVAKPFEIELLLKTVKEHL